MNDYQMTFLADVRRQDQLAEADRQRLAHAGRTPRARRNSDSTPRLRHLSLGSFFGRISLL